MIPVCYFVSTYTRHGIGLALIFEIKTQRVMGERDIKLLLAFFAPTSDVKPFLVNSQMSFRAFGLDNDNESTIFGS